jgi:hypothetical protein
MQKLVGLFVLDTYPQPTEAQFLEILQAGISRGRQFNPAYFRRDVVNMDAAEIKACRSCFAALASMRRAEEINMRHGVQMLVDAAADRAKAQGFWNSSDIGLGIFVYAVLASNDVLYLDPVRAPHDLGFALKTGDGSGARSTGEGWKNLLLGKFIAPVPAPPLKQAIRSQARVR